MAGSLMRRLARLALVACGLLSCTEAVSAHGMVEAEGAAGAWSDRLIAAIVVVAVVVYGIGLARALARGPVRWPVAKWRVAAFALTIAVVIVALLSPLDALADQYFAAHMGQHLLLVLVAAPLLALSDAHLIMLRAFPLETRRRIGAAIGRLPGVKQSAYKPMAPWIACAAFAATLGFWHIPAAYDWALDHPWAHALEHVTLLITSVVFWRMVVTSGRRRLSPGMAVIIVSLVGIQGAFMGAVISFASHPLYAAYAANSLNDQALAGVMMCIPASFIYLGSTAWTLARMLRNVPGRGDRNLGAALNKPVRIRAVYTMPPYASPMRSEG